MKQVTRFVPMEDHTGVAIHTAAHGSLLALAARCALKETAAHGESTQDQAFWQELCPIGDPHCS